jgi:hypothetical protein
MFKKVEGGEQRYEKVRRLSQWSWTDIESEQGAWRKQIL